MNKHILIILAISSVISLFESCGKQEELAIQKFLDQNYIQLDSLIGEWTWIKSYSGGWVKVSLTPDTEGYSNKIVFKSDGKFLEYINDELDFQTFYRIDTVFERSEEKFYTISYYQDKSQQDFAIDPQADTIWLYIYDRCRGCIGPHSYIKNE
jgi:hypothetical protein